MAILFAIITPPIMLLMSNTQPYFTPSSEFVTLCQTQIALLRDRLGATWAAVYLTQGLVESGSRKLIPVAIYPHLDISEDNSLNFHLPTFDLDINSSYPLLTSSSSDQGEQNSLTLRGQQNMVFPLIYEDVVLGLLVAPRPDQPWNSEELAQISHISQTLALARVLDQRQSFYQQQLETEKDKIDDLLHQLRNPLTALRTFSKLLLKRLLPGDRNHSVAQSMLRESDRLQELLQQFEQNDSSPLTLDSPSSPSSSSSFLLPSNSLSLQPLSVRDILNPLLVSATAIAQERGISLDINIPPSLTNQVAGHPQALGEVLNNLIDNALKYTPNGGKVEIKVVEKLLDNTPWQGIIVADTGYGIPPEDQQHIFERHYRGEKAHTNISGTGLGLAIAKQLIEQMHGKIELISPLPSQYPHSEPNLPGTVFLVWLPIMINKN